MAIELAKLLLARVRELREARGLSQEEFAEQAGMSYKYYQQLETGRKPNFKFATFQKLARACGLEPWELLHPEASASALGEAKQARYSDAPKRRTRKHV